jgi:hypothetical protein
VVQAVRTLVLSTLAALVSLFIGCADEGMPRAADTNGLIVAVDWQSPQSLPRRFRNHCSYYSYGGRSYCSDHCGFDYQFYYCSHASFGCCRVGLLRLVRLAALPSVTPRRPMPAGCAPGRSFKCGRFP